MSENTTDEYSPEDGDDKRVTLWRSNIDQLEAKARKAGEFESRATAAERKLAFAEAGIPLADPKLSYFIKGYDGDLNAEAIKEAATSAGFLAPPAPTAEEVAVQESGAAAERIAGAASGPAQPVSTVSEREREYAEAYATGGPQALAQVAAKYGSVVGQS
jgi:hypothetical protein